MVLTERSKWPLLTRSGGLYNQMNHLFGWGLEIVGQHHGGFSPFRIGELFTIVYLPECLNNAIFRNRVQELQTLSLHINDDSGDGALDRPHLVDTKLICSDVVEFRLHPFLDRLLQLVNILVR